MTTFRHVVLFEWSENATDEQKKVALEQLAALPEQIAEVRSFSYGVDAGNPPDNFDLAIVVDFADPDAYARYRDHEVHRAVVERYLRPIVARRAAVQYEIGG